MYKIVLKVKFAEEDMLPVCHKPMQVVALFKGEIGRDNFR